MRRLIPIASLLAFVGLLCADGPVDNMTDKVRPVPPVGIAVPAPLKAELEEGVQVLGKAIDALKSSPNAKLLPDVEIYHNAVRSALKYGEFYSDKEFPVAKALLKTGMERAASLQKGESPWAKKTGLVVRGYRSKIDDSAQPYGLVIPETYQFGETKTRTRLDFWCHGRGENLTELSFIQQRQSSKGEFTPANAIVLHLYGRYCCANKFAGEIDCLEAFEHAKTQYAIDEDRVVMRGFSMGGAAAWQFAVHYPSLFVAAAPGAGFSETAEFLNVFQNEKVKVPDYEQKLWRMYDCTEYAVNLFNLPTVAYSGEIDKQKQAADIMERYLKKEKMDLVHLIGPKTGHSYHPEVKKELNAKIDALAAIGRPSYPAEVKFTTFTLRYNESYWVRIDRMKQHWERARVDAKYAAGTFDLTTSGITALTLSLKNAPGLTAMVTVKIDGQELTVGRDDKSGGSIPLLKQEDGKWRVGGDGSGGTPKVHGLQGPIDDAFLSRFIIVKPTGKAADAKVQAWTLYEMNHAIDHWRKQFRGEAIVKNDTDITAADAADSNLILFGDASSNLYLKGIADRLPLPTDAVKPEAVPVFVYPNPASPKKYVVVNSGFTFREYDYLNNARQISKLPDWAIIDTNTPVSSRAPGKVVKAGFFNERWEK